jgi:hypothetical protein
MYSGRKPIEKLHRTWYLTHSGRYFAQDAVIAVHPALSERLLKPKIARPAHLKKAIINSKIGKSGASANSDRSNPVGIRTNSRPMPRRGLSREESAVYFCISPSKFDQLRKDGRVGPPRLIDGRKVWDIRVLDEAFDNFPVEGEETQEDWKAAV